MKVFNVERGEASEKPTGNNKASPKEEASSSQYGEWISI